MKHSGCVRWYTPREGFLRQLRRVCVLATLLRLSFFSLSSFATLSTMAPWPRFLSDAHRIPEAGSEALSAAAALSALYLHGGSCLRGCYIKMSTIAQWYITLKRAGPITQRAVDRNHLVLRVIFCFWCFDNLRPDASRLRASATVSRGPTITPREAINAHFLAVHGSGHHVQSCCNHKPTPPDRS